MNYNSPEEKLVSVQKNNPGPWRSQDAWHAAAMSVNRVARHDRAGGIADWVKLTFVTKVIFTQ
jgi:hypothetical protein